MDATKYLKKNIPLSSMITPQHHISKKKYHIISPKNHLSRWYFFYSKVLGYDLVSKKKYIPIKGKPGTPFISCPVPHHLGDTGDLEKSSCHWEARLAQMEIESLCRAVVEQLPNTGGNICILGGCAAWSRNAGEVFRSMKVNVSDGQMLLTFPNLRSNILFKTSPYPTDAKEDSSNLLTWLFLLYLFFP